MDTVWSVKSQPINISWLFCKTTVSLQHREYFFSIAHTYLTPFRLRGSSVDLVNGVYEKNRYYTVAWLLFMGYLRYPYTMQTEPHTRHSRVLPELRFSLSLLYVGRLLVGMKSSEDGEELFDERIEAITDELVSTELLHEAAILAGDVLPEIPASSPTDHTD